MAPLDDYGVYRSCLERHVNVVAAPGTTVTVHGATADSYIGLTPTQLLRYPYARHLIQAQAVEHCLHAAADGYDAIALATFSDPYLTECRSVVDIPVTSMPESSLLVGCSCAARMALVTLGPSNVRRVRDLVRRLGFTERVSTVMPLDPPVTEADLVGFLANDDFAEFVSRFLVVARRAVESGADLVIPAEGVFNEVLFQAGCQRVDDAPVMDVLGVLIGYTELMVQLRSRTGLSVGRRWTYPKPDARVLDSLRQQRGLPLIGGDHARS
jgi:Asp/Glu/hydantoin racemase